MIDMCSLIFEGSFVFIFLALIVTLTEACSKGASLRVYGSTEILTKLLSVSQLLSSYKVIAALN